MTAIESFMDANMVYLDLSAGVTGLVLYSMLYTGLRNYKFNMSYIKLAWVVLVARLIVDYVYHSCVSSTSSFGGSNLEFILSSAVWFLIMYYMTSACDNLLPLYGSTVVMMMAIARLTRWG